MDDDKPLPKKWWSETHQPTYKKMVAAGLSRETTASYCTPSFTLDLKVEGSDKFVICGWNVVFWYSTASMQQEVFFFRYMKHVLVSCFGQKKTRFPPRSLTCSPLKNGGIGRRSFPIGFWYSFSGANFVKLWEGIHICRIYPSPAPGIPVSFGIHVILGGSQRNVPTGRTCSSAFGSGHLDPSEKKGTEGRQDMRRVTYVYIYKYIVFIRYIYIYIYMYMQLYICARKDEYVFLLHNLYVYILHTN